MLRVERLPGGGRGVRCAREHPKLIEDDAMGRGPSASNGIGANSRAAPSVVATVRTSSASRNGSSGGTLRPIGTPQAKPFGARGGLK